MEEIKMYDLKKIKGIDYLELADVFGIENYINDEETFILIIKDFLHKYGEDEEIINIARLFVRKLIENDNVTYKKPLWEGLSKVEDDDTFMGFVIDLLEYMWI